MQALGLASDSCPLMPARISNFEAGIALRQLDRLPAVMAEKMRVAALYAKHLDAAPGFAFPQYAPGRFLSRFMLCAPAGKSSVHLRDELKARNIHTRCGYPTFAPGSMQVPRSIAASDGLIEAPFHRGIDEASVRRFFSTLAEVSG
jgi:dTDP-4-amino-4,6-dideoxygalactose transaminase